MSLLRSSIKAFVLTQSISRLQANQNIRSIKRWVAPTLRELRKRSKKLGPQQPEPRSGFVEWNYRSELFAFGKRLNEEFQMPILQKSFTSRSYILKEEKRLRDLGIEETDIDMSDNQELMKIGQEITSNYVLAYLRYSLPKVPEDGHKAIADHLLKQSTLANVAFHLGMKDLILSAEYPPSEETMANTLLAVIGALNESSSTERAFMFIRDFICTQLNQCDLLEIWNIENPEELLKRVCQDKQMKEPEPRLIGDCGKNTVLSAYHVAVYVDKKMIGKGFGEDVDTAIQTASLDALQSIFGIKNNMTPFNFQLKVEPKMQKLV